MCSHHYHFSILPMTTIYFQLLSDYPYLEQYRDCWPINDLMQTRVKALGAQQRRQETSKASALQRRKVRALYHCQAVAQ
jgi:hypothetical protein